MKKLRMMNRLIFVGDLSVHFLPQWASFLDIHKTAQQNSFFLDVVRTQRQIFGGSCWLCFFLDVTFSNPNFQLSVISHIWKILAPTYLNCRFCLREALKDNCCRVQYQIVDMSTVPEGITRWEWHTHTGFYYFHFENYSPIILLVIFLWTAVTPLTGSLGVTRPFWSIDHNRRHTSSGSGGTKGTRGNWGRSRPRDTW